MQYTDKVGVASEVDAVSNSLVLNDVTSGFYNLIPDTLFNSWLGESQSVLEKYNEFEFQQSKSSGRSMASTHSLLGAVTSAVDDGFSGNKLLLLSSGKDSVALALAYAEAGYCLNTLSIVSDEEEEVWISNLAKKLGHKASFVRSEEIARWLMAEDFQLSVYDGVCYDQALLTMYAGLSIYGLEAGTVLIDGMGNDIYFGHIPSRNQVRSLAFGRYFKHLFRSRSLGYYARSAFESQGLATASSFVFDGGEICKNADRFSLLPFPKLGVDLLNYRAFVRGGLVDDRCYAEKTRILARQFNCTAVFPWMNQALSDFVFNLPVSAKYEYRSLKNKLLLRSLLKERFDYARPKRGIDTFATLGVNSVLDIGLVASVPPCVRKAILGKSIFSDEVKIRMLIESGMLVSYCTQLGCSEVEVLSFLNLIGE